MSSVCTVVLFVYLGNLWFCGLGNAFNPAIIFPFLFWYVFPVFMLWYLIARSNRVMKFFNPSNRAYGVLALVNGLLITYLANMCLNPDPGSGSSYGPWVHHTSGSYSDGYFSSTCLSGDFGLTIFVIAALSWILVNGNIGKSPKNIFLSLGLFFYIALGMIIYYANYMHYPSFDAG